MMCGSQVYHGTPHHQAASLSAKDAEISQLTAALNKAKEENDRLREEVEAMRQRAQWAEGELRAAMTAYDHIAKEALK